MKFVWTKAATKALMERVEAGKSSSWIAVDLSKHLGVSLTRNAIMGKVWRCRMKIKRGPRVSKKALKPKSNQLSQRRERKVVTSSKPIPFLDRRYGQCAFPLWGREEKTGLVCGSPTHQTYCDAHTRVATQRGRLPNEERGTRA